MAIANLIIHRRHPVAPGFALLGEKGEERELTLELKTVADVGLIGFPSAGKSSLVSSISAAKPKIADYPFTTLHPNLGVVRTAAERSFVIADIPGLIEGAADGVGLGVRFLKHLARTRLLLHLVDIAPFDPSVDPVYEARAIVEELRKYDETLYDKPRWLVLNKIDMIAEDERAERVAAFVKDYGWQGPVYQISAATREGTEALMKEIQNYVDQVKLTEQRERAESEQAEQAAQLAEQLQANPANPASPLQAAPLPQSVLNKPAAPQLNTDKTDDAEDA